jgi:hypothetical protein
MEMNLLKISGVLHIRCPGGLLRPVPAEEVERFEKLHRLELNVKLEAGLREAGKKPLSAIAAGWTLTSKE